MKIVQRSNMSIRQNNLCVKRLTILLVIALIICPVLSQLQSGTNDHSRSNHHQQQHYGQQNHNHHHQHHHHQHNHQHNHQHHHHTPSSNQDQTQQSAKPLPSLKMIESHPHLLQTLTLTPITVFFYGSSNTPQYQQFTKTIPTYNDHFHSTTQTPLIQFVFIPAEKFNLTRPNPSLSIYRKINQGQWLMYKGTFQKDQMFNWIKSNVIDPLKQLTGEQIDQMLVQGTKGFIFVDFGQFYLLKAKIMLSQFCTKFQLKCGKVSHTNKAFNMVIQLMQAQNEPGVGKLGYWNPKSQQLQIYTKDVSKITENELMELYSGHQGMIPYEAELDVAKVIHPETDFLQIKQNYNDGVNLDL